MAAKKGSKEYFKNAHLRFYKAIRDGADDLIDHIWDHYGPILGRVMTRDNFIVLPNGDVDIVAVSFRIATARNHNDVKRNIQEVIDILRSYDFIPFGRNLYSIDFSPLYFNNRPVEHLAIWAEWLKENTEYDLGIKYHLSNLYVTGSVVFSTYILKSNRATKYKFSNPEVFFNTKCKSFVYNWDEEMKKDIPDVIGDDVPFSMHKVNYIPEPLEDYC